MRLLILVTLWAMMWGLAYSLTPYHVDVVMSIEEVINVKNSEDINIVTITYPLTEQSHIIKAEGCNVEKNGSHILISFSNLHDGENKCLIDLQLTSYMKTGLKDVPWDKKDALKESEHITFEPLIKEISARINTKCGNDNYCKVKESVAWIHKFLVYDEGMSYKNYGVKDIIMMKRGVCAEYVTLFMALMRYMQIPVVYISTYAYNGESYELHAFAYVMLDDLWYPVDVLWEQIGYVDSTHLILDWSYDNQVQSKLNIVKRGDGTVKWLKENVKIKEIKRDELNFFEMNVDSKITSEDIEINTMLKTNLGFACGSAAIVPCNYDKWKVVRFLICSNETYRQTFTLDFEPGVIFTCPINVYDIEHDVKTLNLTIDTTKYLLKRSKLRWWEKIKVVIMLWIERFLGDLRQLF